MFLVALATLALLLWERELVVHVRLDRSLDSEVFCWLGGWGLLFWVVLRQALLLSLFLVLAHQAHQTTGCGSFLIDGGGFGGLCAGGSIVGGSDALA